ncbi:hypothetical protein PVMG_06059 [Plasmodium vivax Mauritania I]|uniref:Variable surface protein Vir7-like protein n=1 Tax=Plasmodium vivax Mauritania I TaxID=1035515 RepID=A0A0J9T456_PLAVI|nr:hypothetical protein PVMG_06059 [Plasmodium vivax Mauritania I]
MQNSYKLFNDNIKGEYEFFKDIENYLEKFKVAQGAEALSKAERVCNSSKKSYGSYFKDEETAESICKQFIKIYNSLLNDLKCISEGDSNYNKCSKFLNYWVNYKLTENMKNERNSVCFVYNILEGQITHSDGYSILLDFIYDINKDDLYKMNILYRLYKNYTELYTILDNTSGGVKETSLSLSTACCKDYLEARYICDTSKNNSNNQFCNKLNDFVTKYNELDGKVLQQPSDFSDYFIILSKCPNTKIISTAVTGTVVGLIPLMGVLYKVI